MSIYSVTFNYIFIYILIAYPINAVLPKTSEFHDKQVHLPDGGFSVHEYVEYPDEDVKNKDKILEADFSLEDLTPTKPPQKVSAHTDDQLDSNIKWISNWVDGKSFGQVSAVSIDPTGNVVVFHRGTRVWGYGTFDENEVFDKNLGPIDQNTIIVFDKNGKKLFEWGKSMFYLPHGLTVDSAGNYWITDVAMHQVFKFDTKDIKAHKDQLMNSQLNPKTSHKREDLFKNSILKPSIILGEAFVPGNDDNHFCKPTAVAVHSNGDFFISDGYCNSRIIKYNAQGEQILKWGRIYKSGSKLTPNALTVPHALALAEELNYILVADREHGRVLCFYSNNGKFHKEYKNPKFGAKVFSIAYTQNKIYLVNGPDAYVPDFHVRGYVLDINSGDIVSQFGPNGDLKQPHDIAVTKDGREIYVAELNTQQVQKFTQGINLTKMGNHDNSSFLYPELAPLSKSSSGEAVTLLLSILIATIILITLCLILAVVLARCRKRGCLLTSQKKMDWDTERKDNFKLSSLLGKQINHKFRFFEKRPNTWDFNKLSNEPETSDEENCEQLRVDSGDWNIY